MTKQEVLDNIRYNENLVNQYQREINSYRNSVNALSSAIKTLNGKIDALVVTRKKLEQEISELQALKSKLTTLQESFAQRQSQRVTNFNKHSGLAMGLKLFTSYWNGMKDLLSGQEYRKTYNGLTEAIEKADKKLQAKVRERESVKSNINQLNGQIDSKKREINSYNTRISQRSSDLSYRKERIRYWQNQLQYAT